MSTSLDGIERKLLLDLNKARRNLFERTMTSALTDLVVANRRLKVWQDVTKRVNSDIKLKLRLWRNMDTLSEVDHKLRNLTEDEDVNGYLIEELTKFHDELRRQLDNQDELNSLICIKALVMSRMRIWKDSYDEIKQIEKEAPTIIVSQDLSDDERQAGPEAYAHANMLNEQEFERRFRANMLVGRVIDFETNNGNIESTSYVDTDSAFAVDRVSLWPRQDAPFWQYNCMRCDNTNEDCECNEGPLWHE